MELHTSSPTPHSSNRYSFDFARVRQLRDELQAKAGDRLKIATGCDFHLNPRESRIAAQGWPAHYASTSYEFLLLEFSEFPSACDGPDVAEIQLAGCSRNHPPGTQRHFAHAAGAPEKVGTPGLLRGR